MEQLWQDQLSQSFTRYDQLLQKGWIQPNPHLEKLSHLYRIRLTPYYASLFGPEQNCPIKLQALPQLMEQDPTLPDWVSSLCQQYLGRSTPWVPDTIGDRENLAAPRLTHRYFNRALLHLSTLCSVYCRFCFRKDHLNEKEPSLYEGSFEPALAYLRAHPEITELILTGGDPLSWTDRAFEKWIDQLNSISSIQVLRIHSRMPVTLPHRVTPELLQILKKAKAQVYLMTHFNHPKELTDLARSKINLSVQSGIPVLNQNVLLGPVNASVETLEQLYSELYTCGALPIHLHHPDWTPDTFGFRISIEAGRSLYSQLRGRLSGPALPDYVLDPPSGSGKLSLQDSRIQLKERIQKSDYTVDVYEIPLSFTRRTHTTRRDSPLPGDLGPEEKNEPIYLDVYANSSKT